MMMKDCERCAQIKWKMSQKKIMFRFQCAIVFADTLRVYSTEMRERVMKTETRTRLCVCVCDKAHVIDEKLI